MRRLSEEERAITHAIFEGSLDLEPVRLFRDSPASLFAPVALLNTVHLRSDWGHFEADGRTLTEQGVATLIHELGHVWQYQNGGLAYLHRSLQAQLLAWWRTGTRSAAYRWQEAIRADLDWAQWNPEQQAQAIEAYATARRRQGSPFDARTIALLQPYIECVRRGEGAPRW